MGRAARGLALAATSDVEGITAALPSFRQASCARRALSDPVVPRLAALAAFRVLAVRGSR